MDLEKYKTIMLDSHSIRAINNYHLLLLLEMSHVTSLCSFIAFLRAVAKLLPQHLP